MKIATRDLSYYDLDVPLTGLFCWNDALEGPRPGILLVHGGADPHVPPADVAAFAAEMNRAEADWQLVMYGRAQHGFTHRHAVPGATPGVGYDRPADERSFAAARVFLAEALAA